MKFSLLSVLSIFTKDIQITCHNQYEISHGVRLNVAINALVMKLAFRVLGALRTECFPLLLA